MISIIVAIAENFAIGKNNDLLWHIPEDFKPNQKEMLDKQEMKRLFNRGYEDAAKGMMELLESEKMSASAR